MNRTEFLATLGLLPAASVTLARSTAFSLSANKLPSNDASLDIAVIGASFAGHAAALSATRCMRRVALIGDSLTRNRTSVLIGNLPLADLQSPAQVLERLQNELKTYGAFLTRVYDRVSNVSFQEETGLFEITAGKNLLKARKVILATGVTDVLPDFPGLKSLWGTHVHHCPFCSGWEVRNDNTGLLILSEAQAGMLPYVHHWSKKLTVIPGPLVTIPPTLRDFCTRTGTSVADAPAKALVTSAKNTLTGVLLENGTTLPIQHVYFKPETLISLDYLGTLKPERSSSGNLKVNDSHETTIKGLYAAGDITSKTRGQVWDALASGVQAGIAANNALIDETLAAVFQKK
jgi:thioredoxin reductase